MSPHDHLLKVVQQVSDDGYAPNPANIARQFDPAADEHDIINELEALVALRRLVKLSVADRSYYYLKTAE